MQAGSGIAKSVAGAAATGPAGALSGVGDVIGGINTMINTVGNNYIEDLNRIIAPPQFQFKSANGLQSFISNRFAVYSYHLTDVDLEKFDNYLTQFGMSVSEKFQKEFLTGNKHFNFVQVSNPNVKSDNLDFVDRTVICAQLSAGVRI